MTAAIPLVGGIIGAAGAIRQGKAAENAAEAQAAIQQQQAQSERANASVEASDFRRRGSAALASSRARAGASGIAQDTGSPLLVNDDFVREIALGSMRIQQGGAVRGQRLDQQSMLTRAEGKSARKASNYAAWGSILNGTSAFIGQFAGQSSQVSSSNVSGGGPMNIIPGTY